MRDSPSSQKRCPSVPHGQICSLTRDDAQFGTAFRVVFVDVCPAQRAETGMRDRGTRLVAARPVPHSRSSEPHLVTNAQVTCPNAAPRRGTPVRSVVRRTLWSDDRYEGPEIVEIDELVGAQHFDEG